MTTSTHADVRAEATNQYSLATILGIWMLATLPMAILSWVIYPAVSPDFATDPLGAGATRIGLLTLGLIWLFVLSLIIVRREEGDLRWATVRRRLRLNAPRDRNTGATRGRLWMWIIPFLVASVVWDMALKSYATDWSVAIFPFLAEPPGYGFEGLLGSPEIQSQLVGAWWFFGLIVVFAAFNTFLGEEFLFRGVLLPKMEGVFGTWTWVANGALFGLYHMHQPWGIAESVIGGIFFLAYPSWRFQSTWMGVIVHSAQSVFIAFLVLGVVLGLA